MALIIAQLRTMTDAEESEVTVNDVAYWTDVQLQEILDHSSTDVLDVDLTSVPFRESGTITYKRYYIPDTVPSQWLERDAALEVVDVLGNLISSSNYTYYPGRRLIEFTADTGGTSYRLRGLMFNMNAAASEVWKQKAAHRAELVEWKAGPHAVREDDMYQHCLQMAQFYSTKASGMSLTRLRRVDYNIVEA
jgi:hypothetical protein